MTLKWLLLSLPIIAGMLNALQSGINGTLGKKIGVFEASLVNFIVGTLVLILVTVLFGKGDFPSVFSVPKWQWLGGVLGAIYVLFGGGSHMVRGYRSGCSRDKTMLRCDRADGTPCRAHLDG
jgi:uncharacterized membrane protein YdcZ (DUF606 family)